MSEKILNVTSGSKDWRAHLLSNFPCAPFTLQGELFASVEGFIQGIKFPKTDERRAAAFKSWGKTAKDFGEGSVRKLVWWESSGIIYGSDEHHGIIKTAIHAKFDQNRGAQMALILTAGLELIHDVGPESPNTSLPAAVFCKILTELRDELSQ